MICGGPGVSDAYYCKECTIQEKDVSKIWLFVVFEICSHLHTARSDANYDLGLLVNVFFFFPLAQRDGCPKIVNLGSSKTDLFYERKKYGFKKR